MATSMESSDSLPYIDQDPSPAAREHAEAMIAAEVAASMRDPAETHPSLLPLLPSNLTPAMSAEMDRIEGKEPLKAIDLARYEALEPPAAQGSNDDAEAASRWPKILQKAYTSQTYLSGRQTNLAVLDQFGKNAWLIGNAQLEDEANAMTRELESVQREIDVCLLERKGAQEAVGGEISTLNETWKRGVARTLETEIAVQDLQRDIALAKSQGS